LNRTERSRARAAAQDDKFTIRKGKKDITQPLVAEPLSRKARFYNPHFSHGKKSLVFQLKSGELREKMKALENADKTKGSQMTSADFERAFQGDDSPGLKSKSKPKSEAWRSGSRNNPSERFGKDETNIRGSRGVDRDFRSRYEGKDDGQADERRENKPRFENREFRPRHEEREDRKPEEQRAIRPRFETREDRPQYARGDNRPQYARRDDRPSSSPWLDEGQTRQKELRRSGFARRTGADQQPISIPHTTAASQYLYGKSVVEAAMLTKKRQLYKLYIYAGANRENPEEIALMENLAKRRRLAVEYLGEDRLPLLNKLAGDRPHNGYVLEASPLPQLPLTSLGPLAELEGQLGFEVNIAHQSAEDAAINGKEPFVPVPKSTHKPLVIVLDQILDPGNLGAILRSANFIGATAVAITKRNSATLTPVALKASAGASEAVTLFSVDNLTSFLTDSKENGWKVYAAVPPTGATRRREISIHELEDRDPLSKDSCILLMGSEGEGLSRQLKSKADYEVNIPNMADGHVVDSLNVSVATALLCSAFLKGKTKSEFAVLGGKKGDETALF
jgi:21S rRNA (GM2251-2'-O)-methyltransferase